MDTIFHNTLGENYIDTRTLADFVSVCLHRCQQVFWRRCWGNGCCDFIEPGLSLYLLFFFFKVWIISRQQSIRCSHGRTIRATRIIKTHPYTWLWVASEFNKYGLGTIVHKRRRWKPIYSPMRVWAILCMLAYHGYVTWNLKVEAIFVLFDGNS